MNTETYGTHPPYTPDQIESFNAYQNGGRFHPFTCGNGCEFDLVATPLGLYCPECGYRQDWAHPWMLDWSWKR